MERATKIIHVFLTFALIVALALIAFMLSPRGNCKSQHTLLQPSFDSVPSSVPMYRNCALISSGGIMLHANFSQIENTYTAVVRMNDASVIGMESQVGFQTAIRSFPNLHILGWEYSNESLILARKIGGIDKILWNRSPDTINKTGLSLYALYEPRKKKEIFPQAAGNYVISSGIWTAANLYHFCGTLDLVGFSGKGGESKDVPYHYYRSKWAKDDQLNEVNFYARLRNNSEVAAGHDFVSEHTFFSNISKSIGSSGRALIQRIDWGKFKEYFVPGRVYAFSHYF